jgi:hypothetical protein
LLLFGFIWTELAFGLHFWASRGPLRGEAPTIDLMMGYNKSNTSPLLKRFLSRADELVTRVAQKQNSLQR